MDCVPLVYLQNLTKCPGLFKCIYLVHGSGCIARFLSVAVNPVCFSHRNVFSKIPWLDVLRKHKKGQGTIHIVRSHRKGEKAQRKPTLVYKGEGGFLPICTYAKRPQQYTAVFSFQHADIMNPSEFENFGI